MRSADREGGRRRCAALRPVAAAALLAPLLAAACGTGPSTEGTGDAGPSAQPGAAAEGLAAPPTSHTTTGAFLEPELASNAFTYDTGRFPPDSTATVIVSVRGSQTVVSLNVAGLQPGRGYGVHAATHPCGPDPSAAGPEYRDDPTAGTTAENELWLDFTTTPTGTAFSKRTVGWTFRPGEARSLVFFAHLTSTGTDDAGDAGARLACLDVDF